MICKVIWFNHTCKEGHLAGKNTVSLLYELHPHSSLRSHLHKQPLLFFFFFFNAKTSTRHREKKQLITRQSLWFVLRFVNMTQEFDKYSRSIQLHLKRLINQLLHFSKEICKKHRKNNT